MTSHEDGEFLRMEYKDKKRRHESLLFLRVYSSVSWGIFFTKISSTR